MLAVFEVIVFYKIILTILLGVRCRKASLKTALHYKYIRNEKLLKYVIDWQFLIC